MAEERKPIRKLPMWKTEEEYQKTYRSEEGRTVVLLGFLSIILVIRAELHEGDFWNFPCNSPCPHFTVWLLPTFTYWIALWFGYIGCMLIFFSEDRLDRYTWGSTVREFFRRLGTRFFVLFYPVTVLFFSTFGGVAFQLPDLTLIQTPYWLTVSALLGWYVIWTAEGIVGVKVVGKRGILRTAVDSFLILGRQGTQVMGERLVYIWRRISGSPLTRPANATGATRVFLSVITSIVALFSWGVLHLSGFDLLYALSLPLYGFLIASVVAGWRRWRSLSNASLGKIEEE